MKTYSAVWRVSGPDFPLDAFKARFPSFELDAEHRRGDPKRKGGVYEVSGFNALICEAQSAGELVAEVRRALAEEQLLFLWVKDLATSNGIDVGVFYDVDEPEPSSASASLSWALSDLSELVRLGLGLETSFYPCSSGSELEGAQ